MVVNVVEEYRVLGKNTEVDVENFIASSVPNVKGYSWPAMTALLVTKLSVFGLYLLHDKLFSVCNSIKCTIPVRPRCSRHRHEHGVWR